jgi:hypothetical protein
MEPGVITKVKETNFTLFFGCRFCFVGWLYLSPTSNALDCFLFFSFFFRLCVYVCFFMFEYLYICNPQGNSAMLPKLSQDQILKLKQLTVLTLSGTNKVLDFN